MKDFDWFSFAYYLILTLGVVAYFLAIPYLAEFY